MNRLYLFCSLGFAIVSATLPCAESKETKPEKPIWSWAEPRFEYYDPSFSAAGDELTLARKRYIPDGGNAIGVPKSFFEDLDAQIEKNPRYADPEVIVLRIGSAVVERVGWGWTPKFSPNGRQVVFEHQKRPISRLRVLAKTLAGNEIQLYDRGTQETKTLAVPTNGYFTEPEFELDGGRVVYFNGDAVNGAWAGTVGVERVAVGGGLSEKLYPPTKDFGLFHLISSKLQVGGRWFIMRGKPASGGFYMADSYQHELLEIGSVPQPVYRWKATDSECGAAAASGELLIFDGGWFRLGDNPSKIRNPGKVQNEQSAGLPAPDGKRVLLTSPKSPGELLLCDMQNGQVFKKFALDGEIRNGVWSPDSRRFGVVLSKQDLTGDEVLIFEP